MQPPRKAVQLVELEVINGLSWWFYLLVLYTETEVCTPHPLLSDPPLLSLLLKEILHLRTDLSMALHLLWLLQNPSVYL